MPAKTFTLGPWTPDLPHMSTDGVTEAQNCLPGPGGYIPFQEFVAVSSALTAYPRGAIQSRDITDSVYQYAGDAGKLYRNVGGTWTDASISGGYATDTNEQWEFAKWRNTIIATNYTDNPQTISLGGTIFADLTSALTFKHVAVVRDFVVAGYTEDGVDGEVPWRVRWCAFQDPTDWTVDPSTLADYEDLEQQKIQRIFGGEYGVIFQNESITRMTFVGAPAVFQFDTVVPGLGLLAPGAAVRADDVIYFLSARGFFALTNGSQVDPIGLDQVDEYVLADIDQDYLHRVSSATDPTSQKVFWLYPGTGNIDGQPNKLLCYDYARKRFTLTEQIGELIWENSGAATTIDQLDAIYGDLDSIPGTLDDPSFLAGQRILSMFDSSYKSGFFSGDNREAIITTREYMFDGDSRSRLKGVRPLVEGDSPTIEVRVGTRNDPLDNIVWVGPVTPNSGGRFPIRTNARYHRIEMALSGQWEKAFGVMVDKKDASVGGRRG